MSAIGPGDWVECVDAAAHWPGNTAGSYLVERRLYQVAAIVAIPPPFPNAGATTLVLVGVSSPSVTLGFNADRFRPVYRPKADLIESLKQPAPEVEIA